MKGVSIKITGLDKLQKSVNNANRDMEKIVQNALGKSVAMVETEAKRRTPVLTGLLRSSIGGEQGYSFVRGLTAGVGTNVKYALAVNEGHKSMSKFMEKGADASLKFIEKTFANAMKLLAKEIAN